MFPPQQKKLLELLFEDLTIKEVSNRMDVDSRTISTYGKIIYEKLGVATRVGLVRGYYTDKTLRAKVIEALGKEI